jgi:elongation factor P
MISATDLKNGTTFKLDGKPYKVTRYTHQKIGRGGANVKLKIRNLVSGDLEERTFNASEKVDEIATNKVQLQYLYRDDNAAVFMNPSTYEQVEIPLTLLEDEIDYIKEGEQVNVLFWDNKPLSMDIPPKITLTVKQTPPGVKGNSATNIYKPAVMENDLNIKVPLFINEGDKIVVDTRTGEYVERAK